MSDYCELPEFYHEEMVRARKPHKCCECGFTISIREEYMRCSGKWEGEISVFRQHLACYSFARHVNLDHLGECEVAFSGLDDWFGEFSEWTDGNKALAAEWALIKKAMGGDSIVIPGR